MTTIPQLIRRLSLSLSDLPIIPYIETQTQPHTAAARGRPSPDATESPTHTAAEILVSTALETKPVE